MGHRPLDADLHRERRRRLIEALRADGIEDLAVLHAFDRVPRHLFVPEALRARAYLDEALPIGHGAVIPRPSTQARGLQALTLRGGERVLEIGTGSGYQAGLLARLVRRVYSVEWVPELAMAARARLEELGCTNTVVRTGDGAYGWRRYAPFDVILVTGAAREVPESLMEQLVPGGRILIPLGSMEVQKLHLIRRNGESEMEDRVIGQVRFMELQGEYGFGGPGDSTVPC